MIGRADIEGSKSDVAMDAWPPQASYPCGNFSDTSCWKLYTFKRIDKPRFRGHLRYALTDVPPQSNSPPDTVIGAGRRATGLPFEVTRLLASASLSGLLTHPTLQEPTGSMVASAVSRMR
ncbi:hypothetical protein niasHS_015886 [Heterodera schachtii]|uniref:Senescence-associated protein n=1 Tax=Heterodera schachtii TaxID=97005 RepID=A0ABD2HQJ9_HETSC